MTTLVEPCAVAGAESGGWAGAFGCGLRNVRGGLRLMGRDVVLFLQISVGFSLPALAAAVMVHRIPPDAWWRTPLLFTLDATATVVAPVVFMMAVSAAYRGERAPLLRLVVRGLPWLPRYLWTNAHTSVVFWAPVGALLLAHRALEGPAGPAVLLESGWGVAVAVAAVYLHTRTLLAPFLAVHGNVPATRAAYASWVLSHRHFKAAAATFVLGTAPLAVPLLALAYAMAGSKGALLGGTDTLPHATGIGLQLVRLSVIPAVYLLYRQLCDAAPEVLDPLPGPIAALERGTAWLPPLGPMGREDAAPVVPGGSRR